MTDKRLVQFDKVCSPYLSGEVASFVPLAAAKLVSKGIAHYVAKKGGKWVATDVVGEVRDGNVKSDDNDGQVEDGAEAAVGEGTEEATAEPEGEGAEGAEATPEEEPVKPTRARRQRRPRAKL